MLFAGFLGQEQAGRFDDDLGTYFVPLEFGRILDRGQTDFLAIDDQCVAFDRDFALEAAMHGIKLQHVSHIIWFEQVVDADDLDVFEILNSSAENHSADAAKTVDAYFDSHDFISSVNKKSKSGSRFRRALSGFRS